MHVLHVIEATIGGTRRHVVDATRGLARRGVRVSLAAAALREPRFREDLRALERDGVRVFEVPMVRSISPAKDWRDLRALERLLRELAPDVVHTHSSKAGVVGRLASLSTGIGARVHTPHTFAFLFGAMFGRVQRGVFREIERALGGATQRMLAVSSDEAATFVSSGILDATRVRVVGNGVDPRAWLAATPSDLTQFGVPRGAPAAVVVGLLNLAKGQDLALRALAEVERLHLVFLGHGELDAQLRALAGELGVAPRAHFLGWRDDVPGFVAASDFVLVPSRWEGMPYVVLEAFAAARPVVSTRVDGARALIEPGRTGLLAEVESVTSLATAMRAACELQHEERRAMGAVGRELVLARHTNEHMVERLLEIYREVA